MKAIQISADFNDLVFLNKNKEYGAYILRKNYDKYLTVAFIITASFFVLLISSPVIIAHLRPQAPVITDVYNSNHPTVLGDVPSIDENKKTIEKVEQINHGR